MVAEIQGQLDTVPLDFWAQEAWAEGEGLYLSKLDMVKAAILKLCEQGLEIAAVLFRCGLLLAINAQRTWRG